ncbi:MAG: biotin/lipoyl-binding protein [Pseudomonadota bacterium]
MIELIVTSFPFALRVMWLRRRGLPITLFNVHRALFAWFVLALVVFFSVFYYHPKSYTGIAPFRTVPVVAEIGGDVVAVVVRAGTRVAPGDVLFRMDDARQQADVETAGRQVAEIEARVTSAEASVAAARAALSRAEALRDQAALVLADQTKLRDEQSVAFRANEFDRAFSQNAAREADVEAAASQLSAAEAELEQVLPAQLARAQAQLEEARIELAKTVVHARVDGRVEQVTLREGARASQIATRPSMVIVPDRREDDPLEVVAGFSQVALSVLHEGMAAEIACDSNMNVSMTNTVLPARIGRIQREIATGQVAATGRLLEPRQISGRGEVVVYFSLVHPEHHDLLVDGSGCIVQTYTTHMPGALEGTPVAHVIETLGVIKAVGLRIKVWAALMAGIGLSGGGH